jgi:hypothetical protein
MNVEAEGKPSFPKKCIQLVGVQHSKKNKIGRGKQTKGMRGGDILLRGDRLFHIALGPHL